MSRSLQTDSNRPLDFTKVHVALRKGTEPSVGNAPTGQGLQDQPWSYGPGVWAAAGIAVFPTPPARGILRGALTTARSLSRESNPHLLLGRQRQCHYARQTSTRHRRANKQNWPSRSPRTSGVPWYPPRDSNPHRTGSKPVASAVGLGGQMAGRVDFHLALLRGHICQANLAPHQPWVPEGGIEPPGSCL